MYRESIRAPEKFWAREAGRADLAKTWSKVLEWKRPFAKWFVGGKLNVAENCLDRHLGAAPQQGGYYLGRRTGRKADADLSAAPPRGLPVRQYAQAQQGSKKGDRVLIYMPMVPGSGRRDARLRAHRRDPFRRLRRVQRRNRFATVSPIARRRLVITADGGYRRGAIVPLKKNVDEALRKMPQRPSEQR